MSSDDMLYSPSAARNKDMIAEAFARLCPEAASVLEVGSGTGEHAEAVLGLRPQLAWQASDPDDAARRSTAARMALLGQLAPLALDTRHDHWWTEELPQVDTIVAINVIHITSREGYENLFRGAAALLPADGRLFLYGPMKRRGVTEESNLQFDASLKSRDPSWGVRDLDDELQPLGARFGLAFAHAEQVPANNHVVLFTQAGR
ncbi:MAG: DUF938 domain-containing protein [Pseudomonadota bacterium]